MKTSILNLVLFMSICATLSATNYPGEKIKLAESESFLVSLDDKAGINLFRKASFNESENSVDFITEQEIAYIQIFNMSGDMEFQLPVMSKNVSIKTSFFTDGEYKLGFIISGKKEIQFARIRVK